MRQVWVPFALVPALLAALSAAAQTPTGPEFRVNTSTSGFQGLPVIAADHSGSFVVVWSTDGASHRELAGQILDAAGVPRGSEFRVSVYSTTHHQLPGVATDGTGGFTVAWTAGPGSYEVFSRRFDPSGAPQGGQFLVNTYTDGSQGGSSMASDSAGNFVVVWVSSNQESHGSGVFGQRFDASGSRIGNEFAVNSYTTGDQIFNSVAMDASGAFVVVWQSRFRDGTSGVFGQRFTTAGARLGLEFQVDSGNFFAWRPTVAAAPSGGFVVAWEAIRSDRRILARRFDANGSPQGAEFTVTGSRNDPRAPSAAMDASGAFVIAWTEYMLFYDREVKGRRFAPDGSPRGPEFRVNTITTRSQSDPAVAMDAAGNLLVVWYSDLVLGDFDIYAQRFGLLGAVAMDVDTAGGGGSDGNGVLEPGETTDVRPSWQNNDLVAQVLSGRLTNPTGPLGASYSITDGLGSYGTVRNGATRPCRDCYAVGVSAPAVRPVHHWDMRVKETINLSDDGHIAWALHVGDSFADVPRASAFYRFVETLLHRGVTAGCETGSYCPASATTRDQMAVFVLTAKEGAGYLPPPCTAPMFNDVSASSPFCRWIEELERRGVAGGCGDGNYCPTAAVSREQMAVFVLRTLDPNLNPPACATPVFNDVPASSPFCRWIEELARRGIAAGCGGGNYCPTAPVTREQMAVFLTGTFGLTLYGP